MNVPSESHENALHGPIERIIENLNINSAEELHASICRFLMSRKIPYDEAVDVTQALFESILEAPDNFLQARTIHYLLAAAHNIFLGRGRSKHVQDKRLPMHCVDHRFLEKAADHRQKPPLDSLIDAEQEEAFARGARRAQTLVEDLDPKLRTIIELFTERCTRFQIADVVERTPDSVWNSIWSVRQRLQREICDTVGWE